LRCRRLRQLWHQKAEGLAQSALVGCDNIASYAFAAWLCVYHMILSAHVSVWGSAQLSLGAGSHVYLTVEGLLRRVGTAHVHALTVQ
jgi:hypothetical protein